MRPEEIFTLCDQHQQFEDESPGMQRELLARHGFQIIPYATAYEKTHSLNWRKA
jgi:hypothetical protein